MIAIWNFGTLRLFMWMRFYNYIFRLIYAMGYFFYQWFVYVWLTIGLECVVWNCSPFPQKSLKAAVLDSNLNILIQSLFILILWVAQLPYYGRPKMGFQDPSDNSRIDSPTWMWIKSFGSHTSQKHLKFLDLGKLLQFQVMDGNKLNMNSRGGRLVIPTSEYKRVILPFYVLKVTCEACNC